MNEENETGDDENEEV